MSSDIRFLGTAVSIESFRQGSPLGLKWRQLVFFEKMPTCTTQWFALQLQSRLAGVASSVLRAKGYEEFLPVYTASRRWSDRVKKIEVPLFPHGYAFSAAF